jgi:outer membrane lipoprotein-sorting protein
MANHEHMKDQLVSLVLGELTEPEESEVQAHALQCDGCRTELRRLERLLGCAGKRKGLSAEEPLYDSARQGLRAAVDRETEPVTMARPIRRWAFVGRMIMKSSVAKVAVAAVVVLAVAGGIFLWTGTKSGVALADVLAKVEQIQAYMYRLDTHSKVVMQGMAPIAVDMKMTWLIADGYGMKVDTSSTDPTTGQVMEQQMYVLPEQKMMLSITPATKKYERMKLDDSMFMAKQKESNDPRLRIRQMLASQYQDLGKTVLDGIEVQGFQTTDPALTGSLDDADFKLWVDVKTGLPVRMEMKIKGEQAEVQSTLHDFQWDVPVSAAQFNPVLPADYTPGLSDGTKAVSMTEEGAIGGLQFCVEFTGKYPQSLNLMELMETIKSFQDSQTPAAKKFMQESAQAKSVEEITAKTMEIVTPLHSLGMFYMSLLQQKKDPAYYGKVVKPGDVAQVLLRWKTAENEYRVIFGDLHAITVDADTLTKLEAALPK